MQHGTARGRVSVCQHGMLQSVLHLEIRNKPIVVRMCKLALLAAVTMAEDTTTFVHPECWQRS